MSPFQIWVCDDFREDFREHSKVYLIEPLILGRPKCLLNCIPDPLPVGEPLQRRHPVVHLADQPGQEGLQRGKGHSYT